MSKQQSRPYAYNCTFDSSSNGKQISEYRLIKCTSYACYYEWSPHKSVVDSGHVNELVRGRLGTSHKPNAPCTRKVLTTAETYSPPSFHIFTHLKLFLNVTFGDTNRILPSNNSLEVEKFTVVHVKTSGDMFYHVSRVIVFQRKSHLILRDFSSGFDPQISLQTVDGEVVKMTKNIQVMVKTT